jgi:hypothetical protein
MFRKSLILLTLVFSAYIAGCATVPMANTTDDQLRKEFIPPSNGNAGLYIYRNSTFGGALRKSVYVDDQLLGESAPMTYLYKEVTPGEHKISTESEFSNNDLTVKAESGMNYFVRQYMKFGVFVGGANLELVPIEEGKKGVLECKLAK